MGEPEPSSERRQTPRVTHAPRPNVPRDPGRRRMGRGSAPRPPPTRDEPAAWSGMAAARFETLKTCDAHDATAPGSIQGRCRREGGPPSQPARQPRGKEPSHAPRTEWVAEHLAIRGARSGGLTPDRGGMGDGGGSGQAGEAGAGNLAGQGPEVVADVGVPRAIDEASAAGTDEVVLDVPAQR